MTSSEMPSEDRSERPYAEAGDDTSSPSQGDDALLEQVLAETLAATEDQSRLDSAEIEALRSVARRYAGQPLRREPMVVELAQTLLSIRLPSLADGSTRWQQTTVQIAETLWDDAAARQRLQSLWQRLNEGEADR